MINKETDRTGFFSIEIFQKVKEYLRGAKKDDPPVIGTTENFCEPDPLREKASVGMVVRKFELAKKDLSIEEALSGTHAPGAADLVNKLIEDESHDD